MALKFQPYQGREGEETRARWAGSLDDIFHAYQLAMQGKRQDQALAMAADERQRARAVQDLSLRSQYGGVNPLDLTPQQQAQGFAGPTVTPAGFNAPGTMVGSPTPEQTTFSEHPMVAALQGWRQRQTQGEQRGVAKENLGLDVMRAGIKKDEAAAAASMRLGSNIGGTAGPEIVTENGQQFLVNRDAKGTPRYTAYTGSQINSEVGIKVGFAQDALTNLEYIEEVLRSPAGRALAIKAGGNWDRLKSFQDPAAEKLANAILQAGDAEARVKTGASYNENELRDYFKKLVNPVGTMEGNLDRIARKKAFFSGQLKIYGQGRNIPNRQSPDGMDAGRDEIQTRTLKKGGSKVRVKSNGKGGWVEVP